MVVAAILFAIAVPMYQNQVRESRRTDAKSAVLDLAAREEKYFSLNNTYTASPANLGYVATSSSAGFPQSVGSNYYNLYVCVASPSGGGSTVTTTACATASAATATGTTYIAAAIPVSTGTQAKDSNCLYFAIDNTGYQYATNTTAGSSGTDTSSTCWH